MKSCSFTKIVCLVLVTLVACSSDTEVLNDASVLNNQTTGTGFFIYTGYQPIQDKPIKVYYHIPENINPNTPIVFVFHGDGRNAKDYRDATISKANQYNFIVMAPEFSNANFPTV